MTLQEAKLIAGKKIDLIGSEDNNTGCIIMDVIVEPLMNIDKFREKYIFLKRSDTDVSNELLLSEFPSKDYQVSFVLSTDGEWVGLIFDDVNR